MPILASTLDKAAKNFCDRLNRLLAGTVTKQRLVCISLGDSIQLSFRQAGEVRRAPLQTKFGLMRLSIGQVCKAVPHEDSGQVRLLTQQYKYTLARGDEAEPLLRWEYLRTWPSNSHAKWCRHHLQGQVLVPLQTPGVSMNSLHLPTGFVTLEEVIRFCIVDLRAKPLSKDWHTRLEESYQAFKTSLAPISGPGD